MRRYKHFQPPIHLFFPREIRYILSFNPQHISENKLSYNVYAGNKRMVTPPLAGRVFHTLQVIIYRKFLLTAAFNSTIVHYQPMVFHIQFPIYKNGVKELYAV